MKSEIKNNIQELQKRLDDLSSKLTVDEKKKEIATLEEQAAKEDFWQEKEKAEKVLKKMGNLKDDINKIGEVREKITSLEELLPLAEEEKSEDLNFIQEQIKKVQKGLDKLELRTFLAGPYDAGEAILSIHAGQGGTEACDWAAMLERMYLRYGERKGWKVQIVDERPGEEAGIKSATLLLQGRYAYGFLKGEKGTHRLVRLSPFNANNLRQTSFAQVEVMPVLPETEEIKIDPKALEIDFFRSSGHGGQNVNKVSTAVRIKHLPTGIIVECQTQRYQEQNRKIALQILQAKLWQREQEGKEAEKRQIKGEYKVAGWGNQIRSYVLHPYKLVKDLRTGWEEGNPQAVLDGQLDDFVKEEIRASLELSR